MRVLIVSASTGSGHVRAAQALENAYRLSRPDILVRHINVLDYVAPGFRRVYEEGYDFLVRHVPALWGGLYRLTDRDAMNGQNTLVLDTYQLCQAAAFFRLIEEFQPTHIIATHFLVAQLLWANRRLQLPLDVVITDFRLHRIWMHPNVKRYFVAAPETGTELLSAGVNHERIVVSGIPVDPSFAQAEANRDRRPPSSVVVMGGGSGVGRLDRTVAALTQIKQPLRIISIAGKNRELQARIAALPVPPHVKLTSHGFVNNMAEILSDAQLVITKAGGLTVSESLALGVPMILFPCLPGQESANADHVVFRGAGCRVSSTDEVRRTVETLLNDPALLSSMSRRARNAGRSEAAFTIAGYAKPVSAAVA